MTYLVLLQQSSSEQIVADGFEIKGGALVLFTEKYYEGSFALAGTVTNRYIRAFSPNAWISISIVDKSKKEEEKDK